MRCLPLVVGRDDVGCFAKSVLAGVCATYLDVELVAAVAAADDHWFSEMLAQGFKDGFAELLEYRNVLVRAAVVDVVGVSPMTLGFRRLCASSDSL